MRISVVCSQKVARILGAAVLTLGFSSGGLASPRVPAPLAATTFQRIRSGELIQAVEARKGLTDSSHSSSRDFSISKVLGNWGNEFENRGAFGRTLRGGDLRESPPDSVTSDQVFSDELKGFLREISDIIRPVREWNELLRWLKTHRNFANPRPSISELGNFRSASAYFEQDARIVFPHPTAAFLSRIRNGSYSPVDSLVDDLTFGGYVGPTVSDYDSDSTGRPQSISSFRKTWSNEELGLLQVWISARDEALTVSAKALRSLLLARGAGYMANLAEGARFKTLMGWAAAFPLEAEQREGAADRIEIAGRAVSWVLHRLGLEDHPLFAQSQSDQEYRLYFDSLALMLVPLDRAEGREIPLQNAWKAPQDAPDALLAQMQSEGAGKSESFRLDWLTTYEGYRDSDQPALPVHPAPSSKAPRIAFIDTGVDWIEHPELGEFLGLGREGELAQYDFADGDQNTWVPALGDLGHGSGVVATLLTLVAHIEPRMLEGRLLDLAMWKIGSLRSLVAVGTDPDLRQFDQRQEISFGEAFLKPALIYQKDRRSDRSVNHDRLPSLGIAPDLVSVSAAFPLRRVLSRLGNPSVLKETSWVWVMAAGNGGQEITRERGESCMRDLPEAIRPDQNIICVGAVHRGILQDTVSKSSNYGPGVDLYAYDSYSGLCPSGTSCSTPAITAAAAMIKGRFPTLSSRQLREVLLESAMEKTIGFENNESQKRVRVKIFDPLTMMNRAYIKAGRVARSQTR